MTPPNNPDLAPLTEEGTDYINAHEATVPDVARFFMYAPQVCINQVRVLLLNEGIELMVGPAPMMQLTNPFLPE